MEVIYCLTYRLYGEEIRVQESFLPADFVNKLDNRSTWHFLPNFCRRKIERAVCLRILSLPRNFKTKVQVSLQVKPRLLHVAFFLSRLFDKELMH